MDRFEIVPRERVGPITLGMDKNTISSQSRSPVLSYFAQQDSTVRSDDFTLLAIHVHYDQETAVANRIPAYTKVSSETVVELVFAHETINDLVREDVLTPLDLERTTYTDNTEKILCPELRMSFGLADDENMQYPKHPLDYVVVTDDHKIP